MCIRDRSLRCCIGSDCLNYKVEMRWGLFPVLALVVPWTLCSTLECHANCQTCLSENEDGCTSWRSGKPQLASEINGTPVGQCPFNSPQANTHAKGRLLAGSNSSGWAVVVIIVGVVSMLGYFALLGYMLITWNTGSESATEQPKTAEKPISQVEIKKEDEPAVVDNDENLGEIDNVDNPEPEIDYS
eukprot:TRINITY_DN9280_c0_g1_i4.p1 TRINITY_DN9280_c0_g1~~TRINITY_DN9280_c0_g1_i4.p1  ORF type:complete len:202 (-),score=17.62 TRINITY_DN9280_c0_g1_i4:106-666(-)